MFSGRGFIHHCQLICVSPSCTTAVLRGKAHHPLCHLSTRSLANSGYIYERKPQINCPRSAFSVFWYCMLNYLFLHYYQYTVSARSLLEVKQGPFLANLHRWVIAIQISGNVYNCKPCTRRCVHSNKIWRWITVAPQGWCALLAWLLQHSQNEIKLAVMGFSCSDENPVHLFRVTYSDLISYDHHHHHHHTRLYSAPITIPLFVTHLNWLFYDLTQKHLHIVFIFGWTLNKWIDLLFNCIYLFICIKHTTDIHVSRNNTCFFFYFLFMLILRGTQSANDTQSHNMILSFLFHFCLGRFSHLRCSFQCVLTLVFFVTVSLRSPY